MRAAERRYYDRRAREYDDWWLGEHLYATRERPRWEEAVAELVEAIRNLPPVRVLDVACGTGFLTQHLRGTVTGLDASAAMLDLSRMRAPDAELVEGDALDLPFADASFDFVFTSHFYGHLRQEERGRFLAQARRVAPTLVVVDAAVRPGVPAESVQERVLRDGSRHEVYKRYFTPAGLAEELGDGRQLLANEWFVAVAA